MWRRARILGLVATLIAAAPAFAQRAPGAESWARGNKLLEQGDLEAALRAFGEAARAPDAKAEYRQQFMLVRRVLKMRAAIGREKDGEKWWRTASALRNFYEGLGLRKDLLALAKRMHERRGSVESATILADALLALGRDAEAERTIAALPQKQLTPQAKVLLGVARARQGRAAEAAPLLGEVMIWKGASPRFICDVARLEVLCGDVPRGMKLLTRAFEETSPRGLDDLRHHVQRLPEFARLPASAGLKAVLETKSKVNESACSSGASCGSCPDRGQCAGSKTPPDAKKK